MTALASSGGLAIPTRAADFTASWLTAALRERGVLRDAQVVEVKLEVVGEGEGFMGEVLRLHLRLDREEAGAPESLIAKLPTHVAQNRTVGELVGAYEREILFYESLAHGLPVRTPRVYYSDMNASPSSQYEAAGARMTDLLPMWLIGLMMKLVRWIAGRRRRKYVLLIEDLSDGRTGDQVAGCSPEEASEVLRAIASVHALHWESGSLDECNWLRSLDLNPKTMHSVFLANSPGLMSRIEARMPEGTRASVAWLGANAVELIREFARAAPQTLQHCDLRLDNVFFPTPGGLERQRVALFDWQLTGRGPGVYDAAYFLSGALDEGTPSHVVVDVLRDYHRELLAHGVTDYDFDRCLLDYRRALMIVLHRLGSTDSVELGAERGAELLVRWMSRCVVRLRDVDLATLVEG